jgi:hypothetical protein
VIQLCAPHYAPFIYSEHRYASMFQAAEALAKDKFVSKDLSKDDHNAHVAAVIDAARGAGVDDKVLGWAGRILQSRNDLPLKDLMGELLEDSGLFDAAARAALAPRMTAARTGVAHGGAKGTDTLTRYWLGQVLLWVLRGYFVRELGVPAEEVQRRIARNPGFRRALKEALGETPGTARPTGDA